MVETLGQYADDADLYSMFNQSSLDGITQQLDTFHTNSGFLVNYDKMAIYRIGSIANSDAKLITARQMVWTNEPLNILGVCISIEAEETMRLNCDDMVRKVELMLKRWKHRGLNLMGKMNIVNTLVSSIFTYKMAVLPDIPEGTVKTIEEMIVAFLWNGVKPKIPLSTL